MEDIFAQGDLLIERVPDLVPSGIRAQAGADGALVVAEGELTGHRHAFYDKVTMFRDDSLAWDIPKGLYVAHVRIDGPEARLLHEEHDVIALPRGTWRIRRQREMEPKDVRLIAD